MNPSGQGRSAAKTSLVTTWYKRISRTPSSPTKSGSTSSGSPLFPVKTLTSRLNAPLVGAKTVNSAFGSANVSASPVAWTAAQRVENAEVPHAISAVFEKNQRYKENKKSNEIYLRKKKSRTAATTKQ